MLQSKIKYVTPAASRLMEQGNLKDLAYHGLVVQCAGHCGIHCTESLWICTKCGHVECDLCFDDYCNTLEMTAATEGLSVCRMCGVVDGETHFMRTKKSGINVMTDGEWTEEFKAGKIITHRRYEDAKKWNKITLGWYQFKKWIARMKCECKMCKKEGTKFKRILKATFRKSLEIH